ncbi:MAG: pentapeptide repeat-containing protein [Magnetospirillum sp.]|nr:pentapeptide repeat-containing protein [Magnetospirillum sp.]
MTKAHLLATVTVLAATAVASAAMAQSRALNPSCKLEAEANCNWGDLKGAKARGLDLRDSAYLAAILDEGDFEGVNFEQSHMQLTSMIGGNFKNANFKGSHMHAIKAQGANFENANFDDCNLTSANLVGANLKGAKFGGRVLWLNAKLDGATWVDGRVCQPGSKGECK